MASDSSASELVVADLVFVGFNKRVAALHRQTGEIAWQWKASKGMGFVALLVDGDRLMASVYGYTYCLDALTGRQLWVNPMSGFGFGVPCLTSLRGSTLAASLLAQAEADESDSSTTGTTPTGA